MWLSTYLSGYGQYAQELLDPRSALHAFRPTAVLFALDAHHVIGTLDAGSTAQEVEARLTEIIGFDRSAMGAGAQLLRLCHPATNISPGISRAVRRQRAPLARLPRRGNRAG